MEENGFFCLNVVLDGAIERLNASISTHLLNHFVGNLNKSGYIRQFGKKSEKERKGVLWGVVVFWAGGPRFV